MSCTFWIRRKRIAAKIREQERLKAEQTAKAAIKQEVVQEKPKKPKEAGGKNGESNKSTDTES